MLLRSRLTASELKSAGIDVTVICDNMASIVMERGMVDCVIVGADRIAENGDSANKIGTGGLAILAKHYSIPFFVAAPTSTIDINTPTGGDIVIEERSGEEITTHWYEKPMVMEGVKTFNPAFDVARAENITAIITEKGVVYPPFGENLKKMLKN